MGSYQYYQLVKERQDNIKGMICLDLIGCYKGGQRYPTTQLENERTNRGDFILFTGSEQSKPFIDKCYRLYKDVSRFPIQTFTDNDDMELQFCNYSDHRHFNEYGSMLVTDTAFFRYPWYHSSKDTWEN